MCRPDLEQKVLAGDLYDPQVHLAARVKICCRSTARLRQLPPHHEWPVLTPSLLLLCRLSLIIVADAVLHA